MSCILPHPYALSLTERCRDYRTHREGHLAGILGRCGDGRQRYLDDVNRVLDSALDDITHHAP